MNFESLRARSDLISMMENAPARMNETLQNISTPKIEKIREILMQYPDLNRDPEVFKSILKFSENNQDENVQKFRIEQCRKTLVTFDKGIAKIKNLNLISQTDLNSVLNSLPEYIGIIDDEKKSLTISKEDLMNFTSDEIWNLIKSQGIKSFTICQENGQKITYSNKLLRQVSDKKLNLTTLTRKYTLEFETGESLTIPHAKLQFCGKYFETILDGLWNINEQTIKLVGVPFDGFYKILQMVDPPSNSKGLENAVNFLQYEPYLLGVYMKEAWEKILGREVDVPPIPDKLLEEYEGPCHIFNKEKKADGPKMKDTHFLFYIPPHISLHEILNRMQIKKLFGDFELSAYIYEDIKKTPLKVEKGYWVKMVRQDKTIVGVTEYPYKKCVDSCLFENLPKEYRNDGPSIIEALVYYLMLYTEKKLPLDRREWHTFCDQRCEGSSPYERIVRVVVTAHVSEERLYLSITSKDYNSMFTVPVSRHYS